MGFVLSPPDRGDVADVDAEDVDLRLSRFGVDPAHGSTMAQLSAVG